MLDEGADGPQQLRVRDGDRVVHPGPESFEREAGRDPAHEAVGDRVDRALDGAAGAEALDHGRRAGGLNGHHARPGLEPLEADRAAHRERAAVHRHEQDVDPGAARHLGLAGPRALHEVEARRRRRRARPARAKR